MLRIIALKQNLTLRSLFHRCNVNNISRNKNYTIVGIINNIENGLEIPPVKYKRAVN